MSRRDVYADPRRLQDDFASKCEAMIDLSELESDQGNFMNSKVIIRDNT